MIESQDVSVEINFNETTIASAITPDKLERLKIELLLNDDEFEFLCGVLEVPETIRQKQFDTTLKQILELRQQNVKKSPNARQVQKYHEMCRAGEFDFVTEEPD